MTPAPMSPIDVQAYINSGWIQTFKGNQVWPFLPDHPKNRFTIQDIAHHLAFQVRWSGAVRRFYSVAEHCVLGSKIIDDRFALKFLMHDCEEAYMGDQSRPVKMQLWVGAPLYVPQIRLKEAGDALRNAILDDLDIGRIDGEAAEAVRIVDDEMLVREAVDLMTDGPHRDFAMHPKKGFVPAPVGLCCWSPEIAERKFLERWAELACSGR